MGGRSRFTPTARKIRPRHKRGGGAILYIRVRIQPGSEADRSMDLFMPRKPIAENAWIRSPRAADDGSMKA
jgi:hypothetical protein